MSSANEVVRGEELQDVIRSAADLVMSTAGVTVGPEGKPVIMSKSFGAPEITKDGYKVVNSLKPKEARIAKIVELLNQATSQANEKAGDGTTTATLLVGEMLRKASSHIAAGRARMRLRIGIERARDKVIARIHELARKVSSQEEIAQIATISANGDKIIGAKIAEAMEKVGKNGVITVEEGKGFGLSLSVVKGMVFDRGYLSPYFATNKEKMIVEFENPYLLFVNKKVSSIVPFVSLLEVVLKSGRAIVLIAEDVEGEALSACVFNALRGLKIAVVKAPGFGDRRGAMLEDMRILTGAKYVVSDELGISFESIVLDDLGSAKTVTITKDKTTIVGGAGDKSDIDARIKQIKEMMAETTSDYDREKLQERLAKLAGGVAVLKVGGATDVEVKERKDRYEDALHATRAAVEEGIVAGGGATLLYIGNSLDELERESDDDDEAAGIKIVKDALRVAIRHIINNCGEESSVIISKLLEKGDVNWIFDARLRRYTDAFKAGIIDPAKVLRVGVESAVSVACVLTTCEILIVDIPSEDDNSAGGGAAPMGGGGMGGF